MSHLLFFEDSGSLAHPFGSPQWDSLSVKIRGPEAMSRGSLENLIVSRS